MMRGRHCKDSRAAEIMIGCAAIVSMTIGISVVVVGIYGYFLMIQGWQ